MKQHPLMLDISKPFATIEDVLDDFKDLNYVLYNPQLTEEKNKMNLIYITNKVFHRRISNAQLSEFIECGKSIDKFIDKYREWLKK
jgi:hypothetical protein